MRILITGVVIFVIWCFISVWIYNDKLVPLMKKPELIQTIPEKQTSEADSLIKLKASMPVNIIIYFEFNDTKFKADTETDNSIVPFKTWLTKYPNSMIYVTGHADLVGNEDYNYNLGQKRAQNVVNYLENQGINSNRIVIDSKGETEATADYITKEGRAKNRRTEISIKMN